VIDEFLFEHSWTYRETVEKGLEKGRAEGRAEGLRSNIEAVVQVRFPTLLALTKSRTEHLTDLAKLEQISLTVSTARTSREVKKFLLAFK